MSLDNKCRNCGSNSITFLRRFNDTRWKREFSIYKCLRCLVEFHLELPDPLEWYVSGEYRDLADIKQPRARQITEHRCRRQVQWLDNRFPSWRSEVKSILDVGAYQGSAVGILRNLGFDAVGYEPDPREAENSEWVFSDVSDVENAYDMVWLSHTLEHADSAIDMLNTWLPYGRIAFIDVPPGNYQLPHTHVFTVQSLTRTLDIVRYKPIVIDGTIRTVVQKTMEVSDE